MTTSRLAESTASEAQRRAADTSTVALAGAVGGVWGNGRSWL